MKHSWKITSLLLGMFLLTQLIGLFVIEQYKPEIKQVVDNEGNSINITSYNLPYGMDPPKDISPEVSVISIIFAVAIAVFLMLFLMKYKAELFLRIWFFSVVTLALGITITAVLIKFGLFLNRIDFLFWNVPLSWIISLIMALPLAFMKIFKRHLMVHNLTEMIIYPGIATIFVPLLSVWTVVFLLILISLYDMYAVWHAGFMQKMAKYQIQKLKVFTGFFVPYLGKKERKLIDKIKNSKSKKDKNKKIKVSIAILGGGDVVFPIILGGVVLRQLGIVQGIIIALGATLALAGLFYISKKGKFYPAMPFITAGCFLALGIAYLI
ncbi:hypothetical protein HYV50_05620 [Candidatus Pacearchaeota archaeon]|nr:hypothetical protein [Candidatus Pacearchaeota archaeon]